MIWFAGMMKKGDSLQLYAKTNTPGISSLLISGKKIWIGTYEGLYVIEEDKKSPLSD